MASSKVLVRDAVTARQGGQLLSLDGAMAHCMSLNLPGRGLSDADAESMAATLLAELRRRFAEITAMRNRSSLLELSVRLEGNAIRDRGCAALCSALEKASGIAAVSKLDLRDNRIGDGGFRAVGRLLRNAKHALGDVRLSGNPASGDAAGDVLSAARARGTSCQAPSGVTRPRRASRHARVPQVPRGGPQQAAARFGRPGRPLLRKSSAIGSYWLRQAELEPPLSDADLQNLSQLLVDEVRTTAKTAQLPTTGTLLELRLDLQGGALGDAGVVALCDALTSLKDVAFVKVLRLYRNRIGDAGARALADVVAAQHGVLEELLLSDNRIGDAGALALLDAARAKYPARDGRSLHEKKGTRPLWLNLSSNLVDHKRVRSEAADRLRCGLCYAANPRCTRERCADNRRPPTCVHLPFFGQQRLGAVEKKAPPPQTAVDQRGPLRRVGEHEYAVALAGRRLGDEGAFQLAMDLDDEVRKVADGQNPAFLTVDLRDCALGNNGAVAIAGTLLDLGELAWVRRLDLAGNRVGDDGATAVADLLARAVHPVMEVDLRGNQLTRSEALARACQGRYPAFRDLDSSVKKPLGLKLADNSIPLNDLHRTLKLCKRLKLPFALHERPGDSPKGTALHLADLMRQREEPRGRDPSMSRELPRARSQSRPLWEDPDAAPRSKSKSRSKSRPRGREAAEYVRDEPPRRAGRDAHEALPPRAKARAGRDEDAPHDAPAPRAKSRGRAAERPARDAKPARDRGDERPARDGPAAGKGSEPKRFEPEDDATPEERELAAQIAALQSKLTSAKAHRAASREPPRRKSPPPSREPPRRSPPPTTARAQSPPRRKNPPPTKAPRPRPPAPPASPPPVAEAQGRTAARAGSDEASDDTPPKPEKRDPGALISKSMKKHGYRPNQAAWVSAAFQRCKALPPGAWVLFEPADAYVYAAALDVKGTRALVDGMLRRGCVAVADTRRGTVSVVACVERLMDHSKREIGAILDACLAGPAAAEKPARRAAAARIDAGAGEPGPAAEAPPPARGVEETKEAPAADEAADREARRLAKLEEKKRKRYEKQKERRKRKTEENREAERARKEALLAERAEAAAPKAAPPAAAPAPKKERAPRLPVDAFDAAKAEAGLVEAPPAPPPAPAETAAEAQARKAREAREGALAAAAEGKAALDAAEAVDDAAAEALAAGYGAEARRAVKAMAPGEWDYLAAALGADATTADGLEAVLEAFVPAFKAFDADQRASCVDLVLAQRAGVCQTSLAKAAASCVVAVAPETFEAEQDVARWARFLVGLRARILETRLARPAALAACLLHRVGEKAARSARAAAALKKAPAARGLKDADLADCWAAQSFDLERAARWLCDARGNPDAVRKAIKESAVPEKPRVSPEEAARAARRRDREEKRRREQILERYSSQPSTSGWKSSIHARNVVFGKDTSKIRYFEGRVVTTSGAKEVVIKDGTEAAVPQVKKANGVVRAAK